MLSFLRALVVDSDASARRAMIDKLSPQGFDCVEAHDGVEALHQASEDGIDLVVTALELPRLSGSQLIDLVRRGVFGAIPPPVIVCATQLNHASNVIWSASDIALAAISKPVKNAELEDALATIFDDLQLRGA